MKVKDKNGRACWKGYKRHPKIKSGPGSCVKASTVVLLEARRFMNTLRLTKDEGWKMSKAANETSVAWKFTGERLNTESFFDSLAYVFDDLHKHWRLVKETRKGQQLSFNYKPKSDRNSSYSVVLHRTGMPGERGNVVTVSLREEPSEN